MSFRRRLLLSFSATVILVVVVVALSVSVWTRSAFNRINEERTLALVQQFQGEFDRRGEEVVQEMQAIAAGETAARMALESRRPQPDFSAFVNEARAIAESHRLDFLEFLDQRGAIISSAQSPARFGYIDSSINLAGVSKHAFLKREDLSQGAVIGLFAVRPVNGADNMLFVAGGKRLDKEFLSTLELPSGMHARLYPNVAPGFSAELMIDPSGTAHDPEKLEPLVLQVLHDHNEHLQIMHWTSDRSDDESIEAIPLPGSDGRIAAVLLIGASQRAYIELIRRLRDVALLAGGLGILLAVVLSNWLAWRVTRPIEELAQAARAVGRGDLNASIEVNSNDELGELADAFHRMTGELSEQRERLVQAERVAAWRELARRLAHELKNPLFPLQLTVENLVRAHAHSPEMFEEAFRESTNTLLAEIANLKSTISRFSDFSKMPQPVLQAVDLNDLLQQVAGVFKAQFHAQREIGCQLQLDSRVGTIAADPDLLHRAISNLVLNAVDAMPNGGTITLRSMQKESDRVQIEVHDSGMGITPEECERLFTPYYTTKQHGTGLGLAIVQAIVSDHQGRVSVRSKPGEGTTFVIELPRNLNKMRALEPESAKSTANS